MAARKLAIGIGTGKTSQETVVQQMQFNLMTSVVKRIRFVFHLQSALMHGFLIMGAPTI